MNIILGNPHPVFHIWVTCVMKLRNYLGSWPSTKRCQALLYKAMQICTFLFLFLIILYGIDSLALTKTTQTAKTTFATSDTSTLKSTSQTSNTQPPLTSSTPASKTTVAVSTSSNASTTTPQSTIQTSNTLSTTTTMASTTSVTTCGAEHPSNTSGKILFHCFCSR